MNALRKVLVVDDDPVVTSSFDRVLSREGYVVVTARNGTEALDKLDRGDYDVVYTDIKMPGMNGLELAERVKARRSWTPVVIITGYGTEAAERRAKAAGVSAFLHKPLTAGMIEASAKEALEPAPTVVTPAAATLPVPAPAVALPGPTPEPVAATRPAETEAATPAWKAFGLMLAAPLVGLAYIVLLPFIGLALLAGLALQRFVGMRGLRAVGRFLKNVALFVAAPFVGLAYILMLPFVGLGAFVWVAVSGLAKKQRVD